MSCYRTHALIQPVSLLSSVLPPLQYQYRPGTISEYISDLLAKHAKRRRSRFPCLLLLMAFSLAGARACIPEALGLLDAVPLLRGYKSGASRKNLRAGVRIAERQPVRVYMDGCFDVMHYGHANALRQARALGDQLVLGLISDDEIRRAKGPPVMDYKERKTLVGANKWVDEVIDGAPCMSPRSMAQFSCSSAPSAESYDVRVL